MHQKQHSQPDATSLLKWVKYRTITTRVSGTSLNIDGGGIPFEHGRNYSLRGNSLGQKWQR